MLVDPESDEVHAEETYRHGAGLDVPFVRAVHKALIAHVADAKPCWCLEKCLRQSSGAWVHNNI